MAYRIGFGYDVHQLRENESLILGGCKIDYSLGTVAHSDGDVLVHAICDAILGAAKLGDIVTHFPDNNNKYIIVNSMTLLSESYNMVKKAGYLLNNIDCTICLEKPKLKDYIKQIEQNLAKVLETDILNISVKATTTEKLGFVGSQEGISAYCAAMLKNVE